MLPLVHHFMSERSMNFSPKVQDPRQGEGGFEPPHGGIKIRTFLTKKTLRLGTATGSPVADNTNILTAGPRGPALLQDIWLIETKTDQPVKTAADIAGAVGELARAMAAGELTTDEASAASSVIEMQRRAIETTEIERRLQKLEEDAPR
jgi:hypothetical protein